jgi:hypothetical protein
VRRRLLQPAEGRSNFASTLAPMSLTMLWLRSRCCTLLLTYTHAYGNCSRERDKEAGASHALTPHRQCE